MMPAFGQLASGVEPVQRRRFSRPANGEGSWSKRVQGFVKTSALFAGRSQHSDQNGRAQASIDRYAFLVETIDERDQVLRRAAIHGLHVAGIAHHGKLAERRVEQVGGHVANLPQGCDGLKIPFAGGERTQQIDQVFVYPAQQGSAEDWFLYKSPTLAELRDGAMFLTLMDKQRVLNGTLGAEIGQLFGELLDQLRGRTASIVAQYLCQLERVDHRLSASVIVGEDKRGGSMLLDVLHALLPFLELLRRIQVVVRGGGPGWPAELALPMLRVTSMQPHIADARSKHRCGRHAFGIGRLIDVGKSDTVVDQRSQRFFVQPAAVPHFGHQRKFMKGAPQRDHEGPVLFGIAKTPGKLHQYAAQFAGALERPQPLLEARYLRRAERAFMGEPAAQLHGKEKLRVGRNFLYPEAGQFRL